MAPQFDNYISDPTSRVSSLSPSIRSGTNASTRSISSTRNWRSHQEYLDSLECPTHEMVQKITQLQEGKEEGIIRKHLKDGLQKGHPDLSEDERERAAGLIQRNYRGHRERRMLAGMSLDPSSRWVEAVREAQYRNLVRPRARGELLTAGKERETLLVEVDHHIAENDAEKIDSHRHRATSSARQNWMKIGRIARRAGGDEDSDSDNWVDDENLPENEREAHRKLQIQKKIERQKKAKLMDLQYFLEMVDLKHRYGSNLRVYHEEWKKADTKENFFYWLDKGEGKYIDMQACPRGRLEREQVRYLSKEERLDYLVTINKDGRLCWAKNGELIDTTVNFKDSIRGIVSNSDETPAFAPAHGESSHHSYEHHEHGDDSSDSSESSDDATSRADKYASPEFDNAKGAKKVTHVSAATIFNKLLRGSVKKNTWIFVADTSFRLYVGIKQSGAFQHSSFLHGSRISAAGLIKIKNGRLSKLSPLSGHYRPPVSNFRAFVHSLKEAGVDMSHVSISRSYAVLVGLEAYVKTRRRGKKFMKKLIHHRDKILEPEEERKRLEAERDKSQSAEIERRYLEQKEREEHAAWERNRADKRLLEKLERLRSRSRSGSSVITLAEVTPKKDGSSTGARERELGSVKSIHKHNSGKKGASLEESETRPGLHVTPPQHEAHDPDIEAPGTGPENAIAPEGTKDNE